MTDKTDRAEQRRRFIAESAREFIARQFHDRTGMMPETIPEAVKLAEQLADELEKRDAAPWSRTIDVESFVHDSAPALPMGGPVCDMYFGRGLSRRCVLPRGHVGPHSTSHETTQEG